MGEIAITVKDVSKYFRLYASPKHRLKESLHPFKKKYHKKHWVFRDLNIEISKGEFLGIIGRNGCGKSTLLKLISGVLVPSSGTITVNGNISALLELGSGMNPELTGMENINYYATILGIAQEKIETKLDEIISFADIGQYFNQPIKRYSSGMKARLAFSIASHLTPDILIIDEVLTVGDIFFRQKCNKRIEQLLSEEITVLLVSHNLTDVSRYCSRALFLHNGEILFDGESKSATLFYNKYFQVQSTLSVNKTIRKSLSLDPTQTHTYSLDSAFSYLKDWGMPFWPDQFSFVDLSGKMTVGISCVNITRIAICDSDGSSATTFVFGDWIYVYYEFEALQDLEAPFGLVRILTDNNTVVHGKITFQNNHPHISMCKKGHLLQFCQQIQLNIMPGQYIIEIGILMMPYDVFNKLHSMSRSEIASAIKHLDHVENVAVITVTDSNGKGLAYPHLGLCDLPGQSHLGVLVPNQQSV